jgi:translocation and assembly module TamB
MRRAAKWLASILAVLIGIPILLVAVVIIGANLPPGRNLLVKLVPSATSGQVIIAGLEGRFPDALRIARVELRDTKGTYLTLDDVVLDWSPLRLAGRTLEIDRLTAAHAALVRQPEASSNSSSSGLPVQLLVRRFELGRLDLAAAVAGLPCALSLEGTGRLDSPSTGQVTLTIARLDTAGHYQLTASVDAARLHVRAELEEPPHGLIAGVAGLPELGAISIDATLDGPRDAVKTELAARAGPLEAKLRGGLNLTDGRADLTIAVHTPAMAPRPELSWQAVALDARVQGAFTAPDLNGHLQLDGLKAGNAGIERLTAEIRGDQGQMVVHAAAGGLEMPGALPDRFGATPLILDATAQLRTPDRPVEFALRHPLLAIDGTATTAGTVATKAQINIPQLAPFAAVAGAVLEGHMMLTLNGAMRNGTTELNASGTIGLDGGTPPAPAVLGSDAHLDLAASLHGQDLTLTRFTLNGREAAASVHGRAGPDAVDLDWSASLADLAAVQPSLRGRIAAQGNLHGSTQNLDLTAALTGAVSAEGIEPGAFSAKLQAQGLPTAPSGQLTAEGSILGAPIALAIAAQRQGDGKVHVAIDHADWKSAHAEGEVTVAPPEIVPEGHLDVRLSRFGDLAPLLGKPIAGSAQLTLDATRQAAKLGMTIRDADLPGTASVSRATLDITLTDPALHPVADATLALERLTAGKIATSGTLKAAGPLDALAIKLAASLPDLSGAPARLDAAAKVNIPHRDATVASLQADWRGRTLRLLSPAHIEATNGIAVDNLRLGMQQASLSVSGKAGETLDLTATLRDLPADIAAIVSPELAANGTVSADARLSGTPARPDGTLHLNARDVQLRTGPGRAIPPANFTAEAALSGGAARLNAKLTAGSANLTLTGTAPVTSTGALNLRATGVLELAMIDPLMAAGGRRVGGRITLDARITGPEKAPRIEGTAQLANGEIQDYRLGFNLRSIMASITADGERIRLSSLTAQAGSGSVGASGSIGLAAPMPVNLTLTAQNASLIVNEMLTERLDANLAIAGEVQNNLTAQGTLHVRRAELRIPDKLPKSVAVLPVRKTNAPERPAEKAQPAPNVALNLTVAVDQLLVSGHGVDAELAGTIGVHGTAANPLPSGGLRMQRGTLDAVGQTLTFSEGSVDFIGAGISDPGLHFVANTTANNITATLTVGGTARNPKITLSSVPELPQDEILAQIMFHRRTSSLSPFEVAQVAAALASFSGATSSDPIANLGKSLGLDRLSLGTNNAGAATVQAGRYLAPGLYLGAKQSASGGTQAALQLDITKGLKLETTTGMGGGNPQGTKDTSGSSVGLTYQFEY